MRTGGFAPDEELARAEFCLSMFEHPVGGSVCLRDQVLERDVRERGVVDAGDSKACLAHDGGIDEIVHRSRANGPAAAVIVDVDAAHVALCGLQDAQRDCVTLVRDALRGDDDAAQADGKERLRAEHGLDRHAA